MNKLGEYITLKRTEANMSKRKLAILSGVSDSEIHKIESGKRHNPSVANLKLIASVLNIRSEELMVAAGYLDEAKLTPSVNISGLDQLDENELLEVQDFVDFIICRRKKRKLKNRKGIDGI